MYFLYAVGFKTDRKLASAHKSRSVAAVLDIFLAHIWQKLLQMSLSVLLFFFSSLSLYTFSLKISRLSGLGVSVSSSERSWCDKSWPTQPSICRNATTEPGRSSAHEGPSRVALVPSWYAAAMMLCWEVFTPVSSHPSRKVPPGPPFCSVMGEEKSLPQVCSCFLGWSQGPWAYNCANKLSKLWREVGPEAVKVSMSGGKICCGSPEEASAVLFGKLLCLPCRPPPLNAVHLLWL